MVKNMKEITAMDVLSVAKIEALITLIVGLLFGIFTLIVGAFSMTLSVWDFVTTLIFIPLFYGIFGFVGGALGAWLYNKFSSRVGGIKISLK